MFNQQNSPKFMLLKLLVAWEPIHCTPGARSARGDIAAAMNALRWRNRRESPMAARMVVGTLTIAVLGYPNFTQKWTSTCI